MNVSEKSFASHILRYVGIGLISGSIVHAGTLGGGSLKYVILIVLGIIGFTVGTLLEHSRAVDKSFLSFILISVIVSIGTGMVSGGTQHYLDGPLYAGVLIPLGLFCAYIAFMYRDFKHKLTIKRMIVSLLLALTLGLCLYVIAHQLPTLPDHHAGEENH